MIPASLIALVALTYFGLLFAIAYHGDKAAAAGRSVIANPYVYSLSLAVYVTTASFYGSVARAADIGLGIMAVYLGPTIMAALFWLVFRKIIRIAKDNHITSLADFISSRYGKNGALAALVTLIAVCGMLPYISLQLQWISTSYNILVHYPHLPAAARTANAPVWADTALYVALILAAFTIVFGTRHLDASERHEGLVAAIAFESLVKLVAFLGVGLFVTFGMYDGFADLFEKATQLPQAKRLMTIGNGSAELPTSWLALSFVGFITMFGSNLLPRQFQMIVVENVDETHLRKASWLFPLYLLLSGIFILPLACAGLHHFAGQAVSPATFVLALPLSEGRSALALLAFVGGLSAGAGMVIVECIALSTMVCNDLVMPLLLRLKRLKLAERGDLSGVLLAIRRVTIVLIALLAYGFFRLAGESYALLVSSVVAGAISTYLAPAVLAGIYWKGANCAGALAGLAAGFTMWIYTQVVPAFVKSGWLPTSLLEQGPFGIALLRPLQLFGLSGLDPLTHGTLWSTLANLAAFIGVSVLARQSPFEQAQAEQFVDVFKRERETPADTWRVTGSLPDLQALLTRFLGQHRVAAMLTAFARERGLEWPDKVNAELVDLAESQLAAVLGAASARAMIATVIEKLPLRDSLTGLPNRNWLGDRLDCALARAKRQGASGNVMLLLSLDRFRVITESLGADVGDRLLIQVAKRISGSLGTGEAAARIGGDEFVILLRGPRETADAVRFGERLQAELGAVFKVDRHEIYTTASIGIASCDPSYTVWPEMLRDLEAANRRAVARGGACIEIYERGLRERATARFGMETMLRRAVLKGDNFEVHYQPIVLLDSGRLTGFEALVRMRRPDGTLVPPAEFIPLTEETGLIVRIGHWVMAEACRQMREWQRRFPDCPPLQISVNLAGRQFRQPQLVQEIVQVLQETGLDTASLKLEVTETVIMEHAEEAAEALARLRGKGIKLLIDDFGTGYSSLAYLRRFPLNTLKIDSSFVRAMDTSREDAGIVETIVTLAHTLGLDTIAEGVETERQMAQLRELHVEYGQGYYFAKPLDREAAGALIADWPQWPRAANSAAS